MHNDIEKRKESMSQALEGFLNYAAEKSIDAKPDDVFTKVVESLKNKGILIPNPKIILIDKVYIVNNNFFYIVKFIGDIVLFFEPDTDIVSAKIKGNVYNLTQSEALDYKNKYFKYVLAYIEEKSILFKETSISERLKSAGI